MRAPAVRPRCVPVARRAGLRRPRRAVRCAPPRPRRSASDRRLGRDRARRRERSRCAAATRRRRGGSRPHADGTRRRPRPDARRSTRRASRPRRQLPVGANAATRTRRAPPAAAPGPQARRQEVEDRRLAVPASVDCRSPLSPWPEPAPGPPGDPASEPSEPSEGSPASPPASPPASVDPSAPRSLVSPSEESPESPEPGSPERSPSRSSVLPFVGVLDGVAWSSSVRSPAPGVDGSCHNESSPGTVAHAGSSGDAVAPPKPVLTPSVTIAIRRPAPAPSTWTATVAFPRRSTVRRSSVGEPMVALSKRVGALSVNCSPARQVALVTIAVVSSP